MHDEPPSPFVSFRSRTAREDAAFVSKVISFAAQGKLWTLVVEEASTTRYSRRANERYLRANLMLGSNPPPLDVMGLLMPAKVPARVTCYRATGEGYDVVLVASLETGKELAVA